MQTAPTETGLVIPVPEIDDFVQRWRPFDAVPLVGVPAHVTILYPWVPPPVPDTDLAALSALVGNFEPFDFELTEVRWFGTDVVYVAPDPAEPFAALTRAVTARWPEHPPYEGEIDDPLPHVTLVHGGPIEAMTRAGEEAAALLPIRCRAEELWLMVGGRDPAVWSIDRRYRLRGRRPDSSATMA
ncbi:MAG: 2'-5' RNA ligase family protein [Acidimicrobiia bacterium]|nr:2'-5' RNA ligase family protein [Acidimicrobiia bacterium]